MVEEEFERNAAKGKGLTKGKSHAAKSMRDMLDKQDSRRAEKPVRDAL